MEPTGCSPVSRSGSTPGEGNLATRSCTSVHYPWIAQQQDDLWTLISTSISLRCTLHTRECSTYTPSSYRQSVLRPWPAGVGGNETSGSLPPGPTEQTGRLHFGCITAADTRVDSYYDITFWGANVPIHSIQGFAPGERGTVNCGLI
jgi:hypothetical protein